MDLLLLLICLQNLLNRSKCKDNKHPTFNGLILINKLQLFYHFFVYLVQEYIIIILII